MHMTHSSTINIEVQLDEQKLPSSIIWKALESSRDKPQQAKAMLLGFWDTTEQSALRIDLWTKDMMVNEMADFFFQTLMGMADTYERATHQKELVHAIKEFAKDFYKKSREV